MAKYDTWELTCRWCNQKTTQSGHLDRLVIASHYESHREVSRDSSSQKDRTQLDLTRALTVKEETPRVLRCTNPTCLAPFEAVICRGSETVHRILRALEEISWASPTEVPLKVTPPGPGGPSAYRAVMFNTKPVHRWEKLRLRDLVESELISNQLLAISQLYDVPLALFEARTTEKGPTFWMPLEPTVDTSHTRVTDMSRVCNVCRKAFNKRAEAAVAVMVPLQDHFGEKACDYWNDCPFRSCTDKDSGLLQVPKEDNCLKRLEVRARHNLCYVSDVSIIQQVVQRFSATNTPPSWPVLQKCWAGHRIAGFPIVVHDHLVGVVLAGRFLQSNELPTPQDLAERERQWRDTPSRQMAPDSCLDKPEVAQELHRELQTLSVSALGPKKDRTQLFQDLWGDVCQVTKIADNRYLQQREFVEGVFSRELTGRIDNLMFQNERMESFLPTLLGRMRDFWAFRDAAVLMGYDWDDTIQFYATHKSAVNPTQEESMLSRPPKVAAGGIFFPPHHQPQDDTERHWFRFLGDLQAKRCEFVVREDQPTYIVVTHVGVRYYVFCFTGRDRDKLSPLSFKTSDPAVHTPDRAPLARLSTICRDRVWRTCHDVSQRLHQLWHAYEQEQAYMATAHTLRNPVFLMSSSVGFVPRLLKRDQQLLTRECPGLAEEVRRLVTGVRIGRELVEMELEKAGFVDAECLATAVLRARTGQTDLRPILDRTQRIYDFLAVRSERTWEFDAPLPPQAYVRGGDAAVDLVIQNVAQNAYKYSFNRRKIHVSLSLSEDAAFWVLRFVNQGVPIEESELEKVFRRGYRGIHARQRISRAEQGTGLGMYLIKEFMDAMGGRVEIHSEFLSTGAYPEGKVTIALFFPAIPLPKEQ